MARKRQRRRDPGEGTYEELPSGLVRLVRRVDGRRLKGPAERTRQEAALAWDAKWRGADPQTVLGFGQALIPRLRSELSPNGLEPHETLARSILPYASWLAAMPIRSVTEADVDAYREQLLRVPYAPSTVARYLGCLRVWLRRAGNQARVRMPRVEETERRVLTMAELRDVLDLLRARSERAYALGLLCAHGLRTHEACLIRAEHYDGAGIRVPARTKTGSRWVPAGPELRAWMDGREGWAIPTDEGRPTADNIRRRQWTPALEGTLYADVRPYDLRATAATLLIQAGVDVRTAADIMGHSPEMLARVYARSRQEVKLAAARQVWGA